MKISVIIPTIGREHLARTRESLAVQTHAPDEIIIENDPEHTGPAATRNRGAARATGDILVFIDDDCVAAPNWIETIHALFKTHVQIISGAVIYCAEGYKPTPAERAVHNPDARWFMGANCAVRREIFFVRGGFPEKYFVYEDKAFALACWMHGIEITCAPKARVYHSASMWNRTLIKNFEPHLSWWVELMADYDVWSDKNNPPPLFLRRILMPRDYLSFCKHILRSYDPASRLRAALLLHQRIQLWKRAYRRQIFVL